VLAGVRGCGAGRVSGGVAAELLAQPARQAHDGAAGARVEGPARKAREICNALAGSKTWPIDDRGPARHRASRHRGAFSGGVEPRDEP